ncbi:hypothetical protein V8C35DRAFT_250369 [Trichoderma chlorosporum]
MDKIVELEPHAVCIATDAIRSALEKCSSIDTLMQNEWAENRRLDFNLWAAGLGASSASASSLDQRLANQPAARSVVLGLLSSLEMLIHNCIEITHGESIDIEETEIDTSDDLAEAFVSEETFSLWSGDSDSERSDYSCSKPPSSPLAQIMADIESTLDHLIRLGTLIRSSGTLSRLIKADIHFTMQDYEHLNDENYAFSQKIDVDDLRALKMYLMVILFADSSDAQPDGLLGKGNQMDLSYKFEKLQDDHRQTIDLLIFSNLRRRNRFCFAKIHAEKLATFSHDEYLQRAVITAEDTTRQTNGLQLTENDTQMSIVEEVSKQTAKNKPHRDMTSDTLPSKGTVNSHAIKQTACSQRSISRKSLSFSKAGWPHPPRIDKDRASFICPCCYQTLAKKQSNQLLWRSHLSGDLSPFTCIFPDCNVGTSMFISRDAWKTHMRLKHRSSKYWECFACTNADTSMTFLSHKDFMDHMSSQHEDTISPTNISRLSNICEKTIPIIVKACPLCILQPQEDGLDPEALLDHIADHIHDFSLLSLPWLDASPEPTESVHRLARRRVQDWLNEDKPDSIEEPNDRTENIPLPNYFAHSVSDSSCAYQKDLSIASSLDFHTQPSIEWEEGPERAPLIAVQDWPNPDQRQILACPFHQRRPEDYGLGRWELCAIGGWKTCHRVRLV